MSWTPDEQKAVTRVLLGSWPSAVSGWGREGIAAYIGELEGRGLAAEQAVVALRSWEGAFPPSAGEVTRTARTDASTPIWDEAWELIRRAIRPSLVAARRAHFSRTGRAFVDDETERDLLSDARQQALKGAHPLVHRFVGLHGWDRLAAALDEQWGPARRAELRKAWESMVDVADGRQLAALASGRPDGLRQLDPLAALGVGRKELAA